jgi:hypothetical protein
LKEAGSTDKGLFGLGTLSVAFWGWVKKVGWGATEQPATLPDLGRDRKLASVQAQRAMEEGWIVLWGMRWEETYLRRRWAEARSCCVGFRLVRRELADSSKNRKI